MTRWPIALAVGLCLLALVVALARGRPAPERTEPSAPVEESASRSPAAGRGDPLEDRLAALESTARSLVGRVAALERAAAARPAVGVEAVGAGGAGERQVVESLLRDVDALLAGEATETERGRERLKQLVRVLQDEVFSQRVQERNAARDQARSAQLERFFEEARLSPTQRQDVGGLLAAEAQQRRVLVERAFGAGRPPGPGSGSRGEVRVLREKTDEAVRKALDAGQYALFEKMRQEERREGWGGGGPQGPGGPP